MVWTLRRKSNLFSLIILVKTWYFIAFQCLWTVLRDALLWIWLELYCVELFAFFWVYGQAFINLFYSSPPLFPFPWKKRFVGRNVRAISVSVPFFPCVNALPSKNTASLFIYCVRRWVLSFSPLFMDKSVRYVSLWERVRWWWIVGGPRVRDWMSEQTERANVNASVKRADCAI